MATKIKVRVRGGKRGGLVVVERTPLTAVKNRTTNVSFESEVIQVRLGHKAQVLVLVA